MLLVPLGVPRKSVQATGLHLICIPYAGGAASTFQMWAASLAPHIAPRAVQLPGRQNRVDEPNHTRMSDVLAELSRAIVPVVKEPYAFFGHSNGALIAYELARTLRALGASEPEYLFVSGSRAPTVPSRKPLLHPLADAEFIAEVDRLNGTPREILEHPEMRELVLPALRADTEVNETYEYREARPLSCPIVAFIGERDPKVCRDEVLPWREMTTGAFTLEELPGDHFFLHQERARLVGLINDYLSTPN